jgi:phosphoglycerol transferase MdoB-like AlkP superfamily enzyme
MNRLRHQALYLPVLGFLISLALSFFTRLGLTWVAWSNLDHSWSEMLGMFLRGALGDVLFALSMAGLLLIFTALTHTRWPLAWPFRAKRLLALFAVSALLLFVAISEFVFWNEFSSRFNFVAVDYLIYTREVIGNIRESYSMPAVFGGLGLGAGLITYVVTRFWPVQPGAPYRFWQRSGLALLGAAMFIFVGIAGMDYAGKSNSSNQFNQELSHDGPDSFFLAARENNLDFNRFYKTLPPDAFKTYAPVWPDLTKDKENPKPLMPKHIVVIEIESLSASFMNSYGSEKNITPNLDRLMKEGIWFSNLYATGTRTVRGLEALSIAMPPLPGQSIIHRTHTEGLYSLGGMLAKKDFQPMFMYGGYGAFDNMNVFFQGDGYAINDRVSFSKADQSFATIWGVADELLFNEAMAQLDRDSQAGTKRFLHIMTTSNHRPYTYPDGRIDIPSKTGRDGAVKYTDWAIGHFLEQARSKPWFNDTLFVIVADHNASVAGKQSLPPNKYLIPALFYWPSRLVPRNVDSMSSQIDLAPTLLAMLGINTGGVFFGQDLLADNPEQRAFLVNYLELGYLTPAPDGKRQLIVLGPKKRVDSYSVDSGGELLKVPGNISDEEKAIALFQQVNEVYGSGRLHMKIPSP